MYKNILVLILSLLLTNSMFSQSMSISEQLKSNIQSRIAAENIQGIVIGTIDSSGINYYAKGVESISEKKAIDENSIFEIGSISKTFTGLLLADMVVKGKVNLKDHIQKYLPEGITSPTYNDQAIQLFQLSNHTSSLPRLPLNLNPADPMNPYAAYTEADLYQFLNDYKLTREIGSTYEYSNVAAGLLGHLLTNASELSYEDLLTKVITDPLGMKQTGLTKVKSKMTKGHMAGMEVPHWEFGAMEGAGAIRSTPVDMMIYLKSNMALVDSKLYPAMQLTHLNSGDEKSNPIVGLGWHIMNYDNQEIIWHNGGTGGYTSFIGWIKGTGRGVIVLNNSTENIDDIGLHALNPSFPLKMIRKTIDLDESILASYTGQYALTPEFILTVSKTDLQLSVQATGQTSLPIYPESETKFYYKLVDAQLEFHKNEKGEVESVILFQGGQEMVGKRLD